MPIATLKFKLPDEREEFEMTQKAGSYYSALWDICNYARSLRKYDDRESLPKDEVVAKLNELLAGLDI